MKPFNLEAALAGEPVQLRSGRKAIILARIPDTYTCKSGKPVEFPLQGIILDENGYFSEEDNWKDNGNNHFQSGQPDDIVGMWDEPENIENLPKPFHPNSKENYFYICGSYIYKAMFFPESPFDVSNAENGQCFRTEEDAQKWIDAMRDAVYE